MQKTQAEFIDLLVTVTRQLRVRFDKRLKANGLTLARARILLILRQQDGLYQKDLANALSIKNATLVRLLDALEKQNLILRIDVEEDKRAKNICLTKTGRIIADEVHLYSVEVRSHFLNKIDNDDLQQAIKLLKNIKNHISKDDTKFITTGGFDE